MLHLLIAIVVSGCASTALLPPPKPPINAWIEYVDACTARAKDPYENILCPSFPDYPGKSQREEVVGAALSIAAEAATALFPLAATAAAANVASQ